ncbi:hypothetical protein HMI55_004957 [Coelomomyces lativittatus]|nr:hypothetical protein HMI55_004957 [Coelomomyces lativittatus]
MKTSSNELKKKRKRKLPWDESFFFIMCEFIKLLCYDDINSLGMNGINYDIYIYLYLYLYLYTTLSFLSMVIPRDHVLPLTGQDELFKYYATQYEEEVLKNIGIQNALSLLARMDTRSWARK